MKNLKNKIFKIYKNQKKAIIFIKFYLTKKTNKFRIKKIQFKD